MDLLDWLLDSDPAIRWQVMSDLTAQPEAVVGAERALVATQGWGASLLALQGEDGSWDGGTYRPGWVDNSKPFFDAWTATHFSLQQLRDFGLDPGCPEAQIALSRVRENVTWEANGNPYFAGETEPCINGVALAVGAYFGEGVDSIVDRLLDGALADGGWNCWAEYGAKVSSFHTTICVLEGLLAWENGGGRSAEVTSARKRAEEYLLSRKLFRSRTTNAVVDPRFTMFAYPTRWYYDVLRGLDYFRSTGMAPDDRCAEALDLVEGKRKHDGRWSMENVHQGPTHFGVDGGEGFPSRWNTLRALRVLAWAGRG